MQDKILCAIGDLLNQVDTNLIFDVKDYLTQQFGVTFNLEITDAHYLSAIDINVAELTEKIEKYSDYLTYEFTSTEGGFDKLVIKEVNPDIIKGKEKDLTHDIENNLTNQINAMTINPEIINPEVTPKSPDISKPPVSMYFKKPNQTDPIKHIPKEDLLNTEKMAKIIQKTDNLDDLTKNNKPLLTEMIKKFSKYKSIIELFVFECICRGNLQQLKLLTDIKSEHNVKRSVKKIKLVSIGMNTEIKTEKSTEQNAFLLKVNFDAKLFIKYVNEKKKSSTETSFLGLEDDVHACIVHMCGESSKSKALINILNKLNAYINYENMFTL